MDTSVELGLTSHRRGGEFLEFFAGMDAETSQLNVFPVSMESVS